MELRDSRKMVATSILELLEMDGGKETVSTHTNAAAHIKSEPKKRKYSGGCRG
jgi:hypothetical protein